MKRVISLVVLLVPIVLFVACTKRQAPNESQSVPKTNNIAATTDPASPTAATEPHVSILELGEGWLALEKMRHMDDESELREFSPEWNRIQAEIDKEVASINDPSLRADERKRVSERLLPEARLDQLRNQVGELYFQKRAAYLRAHKDEYRSIASFSTKRNVGSRLDRVMALEVESNIQRDGVLFYKGKEEESNPERHFLRLTVREMDAALTKFHVLKAQQISREAASRAPSSTWKATAMGSEAVQDAGYQKATPEQVQADLARLKESDREQAELAVWDYSILLVAQTDLGDNIDGEHSEPYLVVRKDSPIYLVDTAGTILLEVPRAAFCFEKDRDWIVTVPRCSDSPTTGCTEYGGMEEKKKEDHKCEEPREQ